MTEISNNQKKDIADQTVSGRKNIADIEDLGGRSGRDDYAGGDSDGMSNESTNEPTERY